MAKISSVKNKKNSTANRWKKGHSCVSNPTCKKHRNSMKPQFLSSIGKSALTVDAVKRLNAIHESDPVLPIDSQIVQPSASVKSFITFKTFASDWSECTNLSFSKFLNGFQCDSVLHKEMLAVLAAITEIIKSKNGCETPTEYYASLMSALETCDETNDLTVTAIVYLLSILIKSVPDSVKKQHFSVATKIFLTYLEKYACSEHNVLVKSLLNLLANFLKSIDDISWSEKSVQHILHSILVYALSQKPKVRKIAQKSVFLLLSSRVVNDDNNHCLNLHPACDQVANFCIEQMQQSTNEITMLFIMNLLKFALPYFSQTSIKKNCESILRIMTTNSPKTNLTGFQVISELFSCQNSINMSAVLNGQLISALYEYQPNVADLEMIVAWLSVMEKAHLHLAKADLAICSNAMPKLFNTLTKMWLIDQSAVIKTVSNILIKLLEGCIQLICEKSKQLSDIDQRNIQSCLSLIEAGLSFQANHAWFYVLKVIEVSFRVCGRTCGPMLNSCIRSLVELRDSNQFQYVKELESSVGAAIRFVGVESVLKIVPIWAENKVFDLNMTWMLSLLKNNVEQSSISYFTNTILPVAVQTKIYADLCKKEHADISSHYYLVYVQLWSLLPIFCKNAPDISESYPKIAQCIGLLIKNEDDLRFSAMDALRKLINCDDELGRKTMAKYAVNYIPILLNICAIDNTKRNSLEESEKNAAFETLKVYFTITPDDLRANYYDNIFDKLKSKVFEENSNLAEQLIALITILAPYQSIEKIKELFQFCVQFLKSDKLPKIQKKSYRLLLTTFSQEAFREFFKANKMEIQELISVTSRSVCTPSRRYRLNCFIKLIEIFDLPILQCRFITLIVREAIMCLKDRNQSCRLTALSLLKQIMVLMIQKNTVPYFLSLIKKNIFLSSESLSNHLSIMCSILAATAVMFHYPDYLGCNDVREILEKVCEHLEASNKSLARVSLQFVRIFCKKYSVPEVSPMLNIIIQSISDMDLNCRSKLRLGIKYLLNSLINKFGDQIVIDLIPRTDTILLKIISNMQKVERRKERSIGKSTNVETEVGFNLLSDDESDIVDDETEFDRKSILSTKSNKKRSRDDKEMMICENDDEIIDFMNPNAVKYLSFGINKSQTITNRKGKRVRFSDENDGFKTSTDGKLIIEEKKTKENIEEDLNEKLTLKDNEDNDLIEGSDTEDNVFLSSNKMKRFETQTMKSASTYKTGGTGIHRKTSTIVSNSTKSMKDSGSVYKSSKARGDVKRRGRLDPYAYIPMDRNSLNRRKRKKVYGQLKNIIKGAKTGAKTGTKLQKKRKLQNKNFIKFENN